MGTMQKCLLLLFGFLIAKASGQDKSFLTWNTEGATWGSVVNFLVSRYLAPECHQTKWILMGDFNVLPGQVQLPADTQYCFHQKVFPALATRPSSGRIIDFGVYGGPINWRNSLQANTLINVIGSDHFPVAIQPRNANNIG
ncbi:hypothetical protein ACLKA7_004695 [Drosophila subpalustris]